MVSATNAAQEEVHGQTKEVEGYLQKLAKDHKWMLPPGISMLSANTTNIYTFSMMAQSGAPVNKALRALASDKNWVVLLVANTEFDGACMFTINIAVPKDPNAVGAEVEKAMQQGYRRSDFKKASDLRIHGGDDRHPHLAQHNTGGGWLECTKGIPEFVFKWTERNSDNQKDLIRMWCVFNQEGRTLMKADKEGYWVISQWRGQNCWSIERWTETATRESLNPVEISYVRRGSNEPNDGEDTWHAIPQDAEPSSFASAYPYPAQYRRKALRISGFPTNRASVRGSDHKGLESGRGARHSYTHSYSVGGHDNKDQHKKSNGGSAGGWGRRRNY